VETSHLEVNLNDAVKLADPENHTIDPKILYFAYMGKILGGLSPILGGVDIIRDVFHVFQIW